MPRYGREFNRSRWDAGRDPRDRGEFGWEGTDRYGGMRPEGRGRMFGGFNEDAVDELSGFGPGGGAYDEDFDPGYRGGYGGPGMGGYMAGGWGSRGYGERDLGGYERGFGGQWGGRGGYGGRDSFADRGYEGYGERPGGFGGGIHRGGGDELRRLRAADIMTDNPECVTPDVSLADAARRMRDLDVGIIPVVESEGNRRLRGVITDRDIAIRAVADGRDGQTRVSEIMTTDVQTCNKNDPVQNVLRLMEREQVRRVPITDREGRLVGIVAQADVAMDLDEHRSELRVASTLERISEPSQGGRGRQSQERGGALRGRTSMDPGASQGGAGTGPGEFRTATDENI